MYRHTLTLLAGAGGVGKSLMILVLAMSKALGRDLVGLSGGYAVKASPVLVINNEDDYQEMELRIRAIARAYQLSPMEVSQIRENLHYQSGLHEKLKLCATTDSGTIMATVVIEEIEHYCAEYAVDALFADPLVSLHDTEENSNTSMEVVMRHLRAMVSKLRMGGVIAHHTKKGSEEASVDEQLRGASAIVNAARVVKVLTRMSPKMAKGFDLKGESRTRYVYVSDGKNNYALPAANYDWLFLKSIGFDAFDEEHEEVTEYVGVPIPVELESTKPEDAPVKYTREYVEFLDEEPWPVRVSDYYGKLGAFINPEKPVGDRAVRGNLECFPLVMDGDKSRMEVVYIGSRIFRCWREKEHATAPIYLHRELLAG